MLVSLSLLRISHKTGMRFELSEAGTPSDHIWASFRFAGGGPSLLLTNPRENCIGCTLGDAVDRRGVFTIGSPQLVQGLELPSDILRDLLANVVHLADHLANLLVPIVEVERESMFLFVLVDPAGFVVSVGLVDRRKILAVLLEGTDGHDDRDDAGADDLETAHRFEPTPRRPFPTFDTVEQERYPTLLVRFWAFIGIKTGSEMRPCQLRAHYKPCILPRPRA